jgi:hypothetical protein
MRCNKNNLRSAELQRFSQNATQLLLDSDRLEEFFTTLGYEVEPHGQGYRGTCPACLSSMCYIGLNGKHHRLYWKCYDRQCESNTGGSPYCHNLLGLVRGVVEGGHLGTAIAVIAKFLGYEGRSWDITNSKHSPEPRPNHGLGDDEDDCPF